MQHRNPILGYSKAPWGLSVLSRVTGIFTGTTISPGGLLRQCPNHYAFHAGQNLPDKEFRYLRTVIVTAAVHWGFDSMLAHLLLTFQHRAGVSSYTSSFDLAQTCVFGKQLLGPILKILGCEGADSWQLLETAGEYAKGLYITTNMNRDDANEGTQAYIKNYQAEYKMEPDMVGASVYDAFQVLFAAFENVGTDPAAMRDYIAGLKDFDTVTGTLMYYTSAGSAVKPVQIQQVGDDILFHSYGIIDDINIIDGDKVEKVTY